jgi:hypothetical protein
MSSSHLFFHKGLCLAPVALEGEDKAGGPAVTLKTKPAFTVSVLKVALP